jgi:hypothetical protein
VGDLLLALFVPFVRTSILPQSLLHNSQVFISFLIASAHLFTSVYHRRLRFFRNLIFIILVVVSNTLMICLADLVILIRFSLAEVVRDTVNHPLLLRPLLILRVTMSIALFRSLLLLSINTDALNILNCQVGLEQSRINVELDLFLDHVFVINHRVVLHRDVARMLPVFVFHRQLSGHFRLLFYLFDQIVHV